MGLHLPNDILATVRRAFNDRGIFEPTNDKAKRKPILEIAYRKHREDYEFERIIEVFLLSKDTGVSIDELNKKSIADYYQLLAATREINRRSAEQNKL